MRAHVHEQVLPHTHSHSLYTYTLWLVRHLFMSTHPTHTYLILQASREWNSCIKRVYTLRKIYGNQSFRLCPYTDTHAPPPHTHTVGRVWQERTVIVKKDSNGFGFTLSREMPVFVDKVFTGTSAHKAGILEGDRIMKVSTIIPCTGGQKVW